MLECKSNSNEQLNGDKHPVQLDRYTLLDNKNNYSIIPNDNNHNHTNTVVKSVSTLHENNTNFNQHYNLDKHSTTSVNQNLKVKRSLLRRSSRNAKRRLMLSESMLKLSSNIDLQSELKIFSDIENSISEMNMQRMNRNIKVTDQLIHQESVIFMIWNLILSLILIIIVIIMPIEFTDPTILEAQAWQTTCNLLFEWFFLADIVINFITVQQDNYGNLVVNVFMIATTQLKGWFLVDAISSIPMQNQSLFIGGGGSFRFSLLKLLKMPKYIRYINILKKLSTSKISDILFDLLDFLGMQHIANRQSKIILYFIVQGLIMHFQACIYMQLIQLNEYSNWFRIMIQDEFESAIRDPFHEDQFITNELLSAESQQSWVLIHRVKQKYLFSWQFVFQTTTSVGQGDIPSTSITEKSARLVLIFLGVVTQAIVSSSVTELVIFNSIDNLDLNPTRPGKIKEIIHFYNLNRDTSKMMNMLSTSVQKKKLLKEYKFITKLPPKDSNIILNQIYEIFKKKISLVQNQNYKFFLSLQKSAQFRRCVENETIIEAGKKIKHIYFLQNGKVGTIIPKLDLLFMNQQQSVIQQGSDFGQGCFLNEGIAFGSVVCMSDCEVVHINCYRLLNIFNRHNIEKDNSILKKIQQIIKELQAVAIFYNQMIKNSIYIDVQWFFRLNEFLEIKNFDIKLINEELIEIKNLKTKVKKPSPGDPWYSIQLSDRIIKQFNRKCRSLLSSKVNYERFSNKARRFRNSVPHGELDQLKQHILQIAAHAATQISNKRNQRKKDDKLEIFKINFSKNVEDDEAISKQSSETSISSTQSENQDTTNVIQKTTSVNHSEDSNESDSEH